MTEVATKLLHWYQEHARILPWRTHADTPRDPYRIWLAEIMLQQTTVAVVDNYFRNFIKKWPNFEALAAADDAAVMTTWAGLGYYARARNMLKCARLVMREYKGRLPQTEAELLRLPGIGPYTAAAIAAIAFDAPTAPIDGNILRVLARFYRLTTPLPALNAELPAYAQALVASLPPKSSGDFAQAMMDLGAMICTPRAPKCSRCPWHKECAAHATGMATQLPIRPPRHVRPTRYGIIWWMENHRGCILMCVRPPRGLLGGMLVFPSSGWDSANDTDIPILLPDGWKILDGEITHIFTHFRLCLRVYYRATPRNFQTPSGHKWVARSKFATLPLPSLMHKVAKFMM